MSQVRRAFNGLGQLIAEYQAHGAAVDTADTDRMAKLTAIASGVAASINAGFRGDAVVERFVVPGRPPGGDVAGASS